MLNPCEDVQVLRECGKVKWPAESIHRLKVRIHGHEKKSALGLPGPILMTALSLTPRHWLASEAIDSNQSTSCFSRIERERLPGIKMLARGPAFLPTGMHPAQIWLTASDGSLRSCAIAHQAGDDMTTPPPRQTAWHRPARRAPVCRAARRWPCRRAVSPRPTRWWRHS